MREVERDVKPLVVSIGCPSGIGPEVALRALAERPRLTALVVGDPATVLARARRLSLGDRVVRCDEPEELAAGRIGVLSSSERLPAPAKPGVPDRAGGAAQLAWIDRAVDLVAAGKGAALVTGPVSKEAIASSGVPGARRFRGHTEHLAERLGSGPVVMAFALPRGPRWFATALVTTHLPLQRVPRGITRDAVRLATRRLAELLVALRGTGRKLSRGSGRPVRLAVAGLNPHAGERGLLGREELEVVAPAVASLAGEFASERLGVELAGPLGAESAFRLAAEGRFDGVVAMYHDQATIACKLLGFGEAVNVTLGLPIVRTSVDHGTAYDLAGTGRASASGMLAALDLAAHLAKAPPVASAPTPAPRVSRTRARSAGA